MKWVYVAIGYVVLILTLIVTLNHMNELDVELTQKNEELTALRENHKQVISAFNQEIEEITKASKERKVVVKEITKLVAGTKDEECLNRIIPSNVLDKLRKSNTNK